MRSRRGLTLIELLVVVSVLAILGVSAVGVFSPSVEQRRLREAARSINTYFAQAQAKAIRLGRPVGVLIRTMVDAKSASSASVNPVQMNSGIQLEQVEVPPPFPGLFPGVWLAQDSSTLPSGIVTVIGWFPEMGRIPDLRLNQLFQSGDRMIITGHSHEYVYTGDFTRKSGGILEMKFLVNIRGGSLPWREGAIDTNEKRVPFAFYRRPRPTYADDLQLPPQVVIDLQWSGMSGPAGNPVTFAQNDGNGNFVLPSNGTDPVAIIVTFSPNGGLKSVHLPGMLDGSTPATGDVHLLVGSTEKVMRPQANEVFNSETGSELVNLLDTGNYWVSINRRTGLVKTTRVAPLINTNLNIYGGNRDQAVQQTRAYVFAYQGAGEL